MDFSGRPPYEYHDVKGRFRAAHAEGGIIIIGTSKRIGDITRRRDSLIAVDVLSIATPCPHLKIRSAESASHYLAQAEVDTVHMLLSALIAFVLWAGLALAGATVSSLPVMWLWNAVIPTVFGLKALTWDQALCLCLLIAMLFRAGCVPGRRQLRTGKPSDPDSGDG